MSKLQELNESNFDQIASSHSGLVVVDFSAAWCGPCKRLLPELEATAEQFEGKAAFVKVDVDQSPELAIRFGVQGIPNVTFLKNGEVVDVAIGLMPKSEIISRVERNL